MARALRVKKARLGRVGAAAPERPLQRERCGLCRKSTKPLTRTECCRHLICDDEDDYVLSYARNSCSRNHNRYTLCGLHHAEDHAGDWKTCGACRNAVFELELYVYYGTNEYNFEKLEDPPACEPTHCRICGRVVVLGEDAYSRTESSAGPNEPRAEVLAALDDAADEAE